ncbi:MAG: phospho-N-acetylmuramoyl-pentapeptide-transferase [Bacteroidetes bacterium GWF2_33_38]|nr:MAG: phospho-N-acetylmuramoyl-pentapeptide-transferase [Bacteroidetes bacterium GWF2_33_38]OFY73504.1 MAG: phospho-N-acetylmuramoyl-pentapeptide-transferase [Bacteroidetes bacterium RIFOXYA12_FULL_33_9]
MLYYLFEYLDKLDLPGAGVFQYISFRAAMSIITSLFFSLLVGKRIIRFIQKKQIGETIRELGLEGQYAKKGTPTMGGLIILGSILIPVLLFGDLTNIYIILMLITTVWLGFLGFLDDYIKVFKKNKEGLNGKFKILGQIGIGLIVGLTLYLNDDVVVRVKSSETITQNTEFAEQNSTRHNSSTAIFKGEDVKSTVTTIPFMKNNEFDYAYLVSFLGDKCQACAWIVFVIAVILIVTAVSNGANMTDGLDGLATGTSAIIGTTLGILAYLGGNMIYADYLNIMYIPHSGELVIFASAFIGATIGFLWYNSFPAQVFMGDTGSLALGGIIAVFAIIIRKELLIPILCGIFLVENVSVMMQVSYFKYTKKRFGEGRRIFKMAPLHHHFQKLGYPEPKIVTRFWIVGIILAVLTIVTLKLR